MKKLRNIPRLYWTVIIAPFILLSPILQPGKAMFWGTPMLQFVPWWTQAWRTLQLGQIPLWNPMLGLGAPLLANYQSALLYPPTWLLIGFAALGDVAGIAYGIGWLIVLHLIWTGVGMLFLTREMGWSQLAQVVSALAFSLSGYLVARTHFPSMVFSAAWLPWILWAAYKFARTREHGAVLQLTLFTAAQLLTGHAQTTWYTILFTLAWLTLWTIQHTGWKQLWRVWLGYAGVGIWAALMAAAQLGPTGEYLWLSQRSGEIDFEAAMLYSFWPWRLLGLVAPNIFGNPANGDYWGYFAFWEDDLYIGLLAFMLVLVAVFRKGKSGEHKTLVRFIMGFSAIAFILALGKNTPIFPFLYEHVPTFDMFKSPTRYMLWAEIGLALLAGLGVHYWHQPKGRALYWARLGTAGAFAVTLGAGLGAIMLTQIELDPETIRPTFVPALALAGFWGLTSGWLNLRSAPAGEQPSPRWRWLVLGILTLDLLVAGWGLNPAIDTDFYQNQAENYAEISQLADGHRLYIPPDAEYDLTYERFLDFSAFDIEESWGNARSALLPNMPVLDGLPMVNNFDPLVPGKYAILMERLDNGEIPYGFLDIGLVQELDEDLNYSFKRPEEKTARVHWLTPTADATVEWIEDTPNRVHLRVDTTGAGGLMLADLHYPGWQATINGDPVIIHEFLSALRIVDVPAGENEIIFVYRPLSFTIGLGLSLTSCLVWGAVWWQDRKSKAKGMK